MTLPTVPLIDGAFYWVRGTECAKWEVALFELGGFWLAGCDYPVRATNFTAISGPIPTPDEGGE